MVQFWAPLISIVGKKIIWGEKYYGTAWLQILFKISVFTRTKSFIILFQTCMNF